MTVPLDRIFYQALAHFEHVRFYANAVNDVTVPYVTAAIELEDPFLEHAFNGIKMCVLSRFCSCYLLILPIQQRIRRKILSYNQVLYPTHPIGATAQTARILLEMVQELEARSSSSTSCAPIRLPFQRRT